MSDSSQPLAQPPVDWEKIRQDFPVLIDGFQGKPIAYLDSAASSQMPRPVLQELTEFITHSYANIHRGLYALSEASTSAYEEARATIASFIGVTDPDTCIFTRGTTESLNIIARTWGEANINEGDEIVLPVMEHHSNLVPWQQLAIRKKARLRWVEISNDGTLDLDSLEEALSGNPKLMTFTWVSNVFGTINPVKEITARAHAKGALVVLDGAQGVPHLKCDVQDLGIDFLAFSGHKMLGPTGIGVLWGKRQLLETMPIYEFGGSMISSVRRDRSSWDELPNRFEAGTPNISGAIGLGAACRYISRIGQDAIRQHGDELLSYAINTLNELDGLQVLGPNSIEKRSSVLSFYFRGLHPHDIATLLGREGVCVRAGHHCCQPLMREIGLMGTTRASFYLYNNKQDVDLLASALKKVGSVFKGVQAPSCWGKPHCPQKPCKLCPLESRAIPTINVTTTSRAKKEH